MYSSTHSLTSALDGGELAASRPSRFTPQGKSPWYPLDRRLGGPQSRSGRGGEANKIKHGGQEITAVKTAQEGRVWFIGALLEFCR
jgi:hypothetical protein